MLAGLARDHRILVAVDEAGNAAAHSAAAVAAGSTLGIMVEVDTGMDRCGVDTAQECLALAAHAEGYAVVAPSLDAPRRLRRALAPWSDDAGRDPGFSRPLLCPSVVHGVELERLPDIEGLPAFAAPSVEPWIYDGRVVIRTA